jgi:hypothetical protein
MLPKLTELGAANFSLFTLIKTENPKLLEGAEADYWLAQN